MKLAIVYDYLAQKGGAERVVLELNRIFPDAPIYTVIYNQKSAPEEFRQLDVRTSGLQRLPFSRTKFEMYLPLYAFAVEQFDLREYDVVLSVGTMVAKGVVTGSRTCHISICFTPMRWAWDLYHDYIEELKSAPWVRWPFRLLAHYYRMWDVASAPRVSFFIAGSQVAARRIRKHYGRESQVIHPPVDVDKYQPNGKPPEDFFLVVSRLVYAKRIDLVVRAFANNGRRLVVIGQGERLRHLKAMATPNVQFLGFQPDEVVRDYYARCRALIFPGEEDFGLTPVEAKASGRPTIAYAAGGALETVQDGQTGLFFPHQTPDSLAQAIDRFDTMEFDADLLRQDSRRFASEIFEKKIRKFVREKYVEYMQTYFGPEEYSK